jgi:predicted phosphatase
MDQAKKFYSYAVSKFRGLNTKSLDSENLIKAAAKKIYPEINFEELSINTKVNQKINYDILSLLSSFSLNLGTWEEISRIEGVIYYYPINDKFIDDLKNFKLSNEYQKIIIDPLKFKGILITRLEEYLLKESIISRDGYILITNISLREDKKINIKNIRKGILSEIRKINSNQILSSKTETVPQILEVVKVEHEIVIEKLTNQEKKQKKFDEMLNNLSDRMNELEHKRLIKKPSKNIQLPSFESLKPSSKLNEEIIPENNLNPISSTYTTVNAALLTSKPDERRGGIVYKKTKVTKPEINPLLKIASYCLQMLAGYLEEYKNLNLSGIDSTIFHHGLKLNLRQFFMALAYYANFLKYKFKALNDEKWFEIFIALVHKRCSLQPLVKIAQESCKSFPLFIEKLEEKILLKKTLTEIIENEFNHSEKSSSDYFRNILTELASIPEIMKVFDGKTSFHRLATERLKQSAGGTTIKTYEEFENVLYYIERIDVIIEIFISLGEDYARLCDLGKKQDLKKIPGLERFLWECKNSFRNPACHELKLEQETLFIRGLFDPEDIFALYLKSQQFSESALNLLQQKQPRLDKDIVPDEQKSQNLTYKPERGSRI